MKIANSQGQAGADSGTIALSMREPQQVTASSSNYFPILSSAIRYALENSDSISALNPTDLKSLEELRGSNLGELKRTFVTRNIWADQRVRGGNRTSDFPLMLSREQRVAVAKALEAYQHKLRKRQNEVAAQADSRAASEKVALSLQSSAMMAKNCWDSVSLRRTPSIWVKLMSLELARMVTAFSEEYPESAERSPLKII
jgi:hypothetical protein